jgi:hypothetical protein
MHPSMKKLFGKLVIERRARARDWPGVVFVYKDYIDSLDNKTRAMAIIANRYYKRRGGAVTGLPLADKASDYNIVVPTPRMKRMLFMNIFNSSEEDYGM